MFLLNRPVNVVLFQLHRMDWGSLYTAQTIYSEYTVLDAKRKCLPWRIFWISDILWSFLLFVFHKDTENSVVIYAGKWFLKILSKNFLLCRITYHTDFLSYVLQFSVNGLLWLNYRFRMSVLLANVFVYYFIWIYHHE